MEALKEILNRSSSHTSTPSPSPFSIPDEPEINIEQKRETLRRALNLTSWDNTFASFHPRTGTERAVRYFRELAAGSSWHMLLCYGSVGCGKTHLCEALVIKLLERGIRVRVNEWPSVVRLLKKAMNNNGQYDELFERYCRMPWLILDDAGRGGTDSAWAWSELDEIVNYRYRENLPTVLTTNVDPTKLPDRAISRFKDALKGRIVLNEGEDFRPSKVPVKDS